MSTDALTSRAFYITLVVELDRTALAAHLAARLQLENGGLLVPDLGGSRLTPSPCSPACSTTGTATALTSASGADFRIVCQVLPGKLANVRALRQPNLRVPRGSRAHSSMNTCMLLYAWYSPHVTMPRSGPGPNSRPSVIRSI